MPPLEAFPRSHIVTFKYYVGVIFFLEENYKQVHTLSQSSNKMNLTDITQAEENLTEAYKLCLSSSHRNREYVPNTMILFLHLPLSLALKYTSCPSRNIIFAFYLG